MAELLSFQEFASFPQLFKTYCSDYDVLADHFNGDWRDPEELKRAAERAASHPRDRDVLVSVLHEQNKAWNAGEETLENVGRLGDPDVVAVVTGQQVGLFGGPLYTLLKTITTLKLADELAARTGKPVVPVFWLEGEDHDLEEVATSWLFRRNEPVSVTLAKNNDRQSVGSLALGNEASDVIASLRDILPASDFQAAVMGMVEDAYRPENTLLEAFARLMHQLFSGSGLVCMDPSDKRLKQVAAPLFEREVQEHAESSQRLQDATARLADSFHAQVESSSTNLFMLDEGRRVPLDAVNGKFENRLTGATLSSSELMEVVQHQPENLSPNVVLRPLVQDTLLPTAAYVGGPGEISYFAQYKSLYEWAGLPMPIIYPRASATLVESKVQKVLEKFALTTPQLEGDIEPLFERIVRDSMKVDIEGSFSAAAAKIHQAINELKPDVQEVDRTLGPSAEATRAAIANALTDLESKVVKAEKRAHDEVKAQLQKAQANLFPNGKLQERIISPMYYFNKYGLSLISRLEGELSLSTGKHQVITL